ncbi:acyl-CoA synthetase [Pseudomonadales bacterium]|jgi:acyl-CoA synthetase (AMP-forming)/AMP-acid ligase II|nr:acyl-CoA synthetase [Pseudomonadales bacterium]MDB2646818.1 acyl-CoA synthetase [Pseudomonadales bacterium]
MSPAEIAAENPQKIAYIMAETGETVTYSELEAAANQGAQLLRSLGLQRGDHIAILLENHPRFFQICWAAQRAGIYYTAISWRLQQQEVEYIVNNCEARVFITSIERKEVVQPLLDKMACVEKSYMLDGVVDGFESWEEALAGMPSTEIADQSEGAPMLYSSGTTGYPKGVKRPLPEQDYGVEVDLNLLRVLYGANDDSIYLSPAPLYHAAPLAFTMGCLRSGTTVVVMAHFEAEFALECIENYRITHSQWVPTMFVRMLKLPEEVRLKYDVSSLRCAIHAAAPCPIPIKEKMIDWWGPVIYEYYAGTEGNGFVQLNSEEWLAHKGSVGKPLTCEIHICDEHGEEVPAGESGAIYMSGGGTFEYYKDDDKTADSRHAQGWSTLGDVGYLDDDGYLYLTDRKHFMIISGGVNIYPQEAENVLINHDKVMDVAVFGVPNADFGEEVKGVVQLADPSLASPLLEVELLDYCREYLSHIKCPRSIDFRDELPRHPTGKLYKRLLKDEYWAKAGA